MSNILIPNKQNLEKLISNIKNDGISKFHVLADWNRTFTTAHINGEYAPSSFSLIRNGKFLDPKYNEEANALFNVYHPIEVDPNVSREEKVEKMTEWWRKHLELMIHYGINKQVFESIAKSKQTNLREKAREVLDFLAKNNVPLVIVSAGMGDMILSNLEEENKLTENIHLVSNLFEFDNSGKALGIKDTTIHPFNKHEVIAQSKPFFKQIESRSNVILLGDSEEDLEMVTGFNVQNLIKIGFLNDKIDERKEWFEKNFDLIILDDGDMSSVSEVLETLFNENENEKDSESTKLMGNPMSMILNRGLLSY